MPKGDERNFNDRDAWVALAVGLGCVVALLIWLYWTSPTLPATLNYIIGVMVAIVAGLLAKHILGTISIEAEQRGDIQVKIITKGPIAVMMVVLILWWFYSPVRGSATSEDLKGINESLESLHERVRDQPTLEEWRRLIEQDISPGNHVQAESSDKSGAYTETELPLLRQIPEGATLYDQALQQIGKGYLERAHNLLTSKGAEDLPTEQRLKGLAYCAFYEGRYPAAIKDLESLVSMQPGDPDVAEALGAVYQYAGKYPRATALFENVVRIRKDSETIDHGALSLSLSNLGCALLLGDSSGQAKRALDEALQELEKAPDKSAVRFARLHSNIGMYYRSQGQVALAETSLLIAAESIRETDVRGDIQRAAIMNNLGALLVESSSRFDEAREYLALAMKLRQRAFGQFHPAVAEVLLNMAALEVRQNKDYITAESHLKRALKIVTDVLQEDHPLRATILNNLATYYIKQEAKRELAEPLLRESLRIRIVVYGEQSAQAAVANNNLAVCLVMKGSLDEALVFATKAVDFYEKRGLQATKAGQDAQTTLVGVKSAIEKRRTGSKVDISIGKQ